jgi:hypothetical protein
MYDRMIIMKYYDWPMKRKKLPAGIYTFVKIHGADYCIIDKAPLA